VISRFGGADGPGWSAPADGELSEHFTDRFLGPEIARTMVTDLSRIAARLREELVVTQDDPLQARVRVGGTPHLQLRRGPGCGSRGRREGVR
jgi:hypothetical protein